MEVNPISLANLSRAGRKPLDYAGRDLVVQAIADSLAEEVQTDDEIRHYLCKVDDFEVTPKVRAEVLRRRALIIYETIFSGIVGAIAAGGEVSINGFATFYVDRPEDTAPVWIQWATGQMFPVLPSDIVAYEDRTAEIDAGSWEGGEVGEHLLPRHVAAGETGYFDYQSGHVVPWNAAGLAMDAGLLIVYNRVKISAVGTDGVSREYRVGGLNIRVWVNRSLIDNGLGQDQDVSFMPVVDQRTPLEAERTAAGVTEEDKAENLGTVGLPMGIFEYSQVAARGLSSVDAGRVAREDFYGVVAAEVVKAFPRRVKVQRRAGATFDGARIPWEQFAAAFGDQENYLRSVGAWPERVRGFGATVKAEFRKAFVEAVQ